MGQIFSSKEPSVYGRGDTRYDTLRVQLDILNDSVDLITKERNKAVEEINNLRIELLRVSNINNEQDKRLSELIAKDHTLSVENGRQRSELIQTQKSLNKLKIMKDDIELGLSTQRNTLREELSLARSRITELSSQHDQSEKNLVDTREQLEVLREENSVLASAVHAIDDVTDRLQDRLKTNSEIQDHPATSPSEL